MAFVVRSEKVATHIKEPINDLIGPGTYIGHEDKIQGKSFAPFNSSEPRNEKVQKGHKELSPGPGN